MFCQQCRQINVLKKSSNKYISWRYARLLSTATATVSTEVETSLTYSKDDVINHTSADYLKFYSVPKELTQTNLTDVIPTQFKELSKALNESTILLRKPSLRVISRLNEERSPEKFLFYGNGGGGKTISLLHIIHYCLQSNWLVLFVPNAVRFMDSQKKTNVQESQWNPSRVDQPQEAMEWLKLFKNMNLNHLTELKTSQNYIWGKRESTEKGKPLLDVLEQGIGRSLFSTDVIGVLLKELRLQKNVKVLYAVDAFNSFYGKTSHRLFDKQVDIENLALRHHFLKPLNHQHSLQTGGYVVSLSQAVQYLDRRANPRLLEEMLPDDVLSNLGDINGIEVDNFTEDEYLHMMTYYKQKGWLTRDLNDDLLREVRFMTNRNPTLVRKFCSSL